MRKRTISYLLPGLVVLALVLGMTGTANAGIYHLTSNVPMDPSDGLFFEGWVEFKPSVDLTIAGAHLTTSDYAAWEFTYGAASWSSANGDIFLSGFDDVYLGTQKGAAGTDTNMIGFWTIAVGRSEFNGNPTSGTFAFNQGELFRYLQLFNGDSSFIYVSPTGLNDPAPGPGNYYSGANVPGTWGVPEPGTLSLLASGLLVGCLATFRRRFQ